MQGSVANRRRFRRYDVGDVRGSLVFSLDVKVQNVSLTGMALETTSLLTVGRTYELKLPHRGRIIHLPVEVQWSHMVSTRQLDRGEVVAVYEAGVDFRQALDEKAREILSFIEAHIVVELERRISGRFKIEVGDTVSVASEYEFRVVRISRGGMLIQAELHPEVDSRFEMEVRPDGRIVTVLGRVASVEQRADGQNELGIEFVRIGPEDQRALERYIEQLID